MDKSGFSPKTMLLIGAAAIALFALSVLLHAYESPFMNSKGRSGPGAYSTSAIGYAGFYDLLVRLERNVSRGGGEALDRLGDDGVLILAEPDSTALSKKDAPELEPFVAPVLLLVLPKWRGERDPSRPAWISRAELLPYASALTTLDPVDDSAGMFRTSWPEKWSVNAFESAPTGKGTLQLFTSESFAPLVGTADAMLVGEMWTDDDARIVVLSDPDVISNHGIGMGGNADFVVELLDRLTDADPAVPVVFDESVHGYGAAGESPLRLLFEFPFVVATILACCSALVIVVAGIGRFGPAARRKAGLRYGKSGLIDNSARLMHHAGHHADVLRRYVLMTIRSTARKMHAPRDLDEMGQAEWLDAVGKSRKMTVSCADVLRRAVSEKGDWAGIPRLMQCAGEIHRWRGMMLASGLLKEINPSQLKK